MARVAGVNIPDNKHAEISLTYVYGIGKTRKRSICSSIGVDPSTKISALSVDPLRVLRPEVRKFIAPLS
jgi:Ribosomal protein S13